MTSLTRTLLPALLLAMLAPPLLLLLIRIFQPTLLDTAWPWLGTVALAAVGVISVSQYLYLRSERAAKQLLAASRGEVEALPFDGEPLGPVQQALVTIVEQHRRSESELRASEQRFQLALEASGAHLWEYCLRTGKFTFDASIAKSLLGIDHLSPDLSLQQYMDCLHPDDIEPVLLSRRELYRTGELNCEYRILHATRGYLWVRGRGRLVRSDRDGAPERALGTICDITDLKRIEERLQAALITAQDANHTRAQFLSGISHELRTPLNGVLGYTQLLLRDSATDGEPRRHLEAIERCGQHLLQLINDIIDLAQIDSGHLELREVECDLHALLDNVAHVARQQAEAKQLPFALELDSTLPPLVLIDELKLRQILANLLNNAVKFTEAGLVTLKVRVDASSLRFEVRDTGIGIAAERLARLFEPFSHGSGANGDSGLGLAVSQRLCQLMGGNIEVSSAFGAGSCFSFTLPCRAIDLPQVSLQHAGAAGLTALASEPLRYLPESALAPLRSALALGDFEGLRAALFELRQRVPAAHAIIDHCNMLLESFELERIRELLEDVPGSV